MIEFVDNFVTILLQQLLKCHEKIVALSGTNKYVQQL